MESEESSIEQLETRLFALETQLAVAWSSVNPHSFEFREVAKKLSRIERLLIHLRSLVRERKLLLLEQSSWTAKQQHQHLSSITDCSNQLDQIQSVREHQLAQQQQQQQQLRQPQQHFDKAGGVIVSDAVTACGSPVVCSSYFKQTTTSQQSLPIKGSSQQQFISGARGADGRTNFASAEAQASDYQSSPQSTLRHSSHHRLPYQQDCPTSAADYSSKVRYNEAKNRPSANDGAVANQLSRLGPVQERDQGSGASPSNHQELGCASFRLQPTNGGAGAALAPSSSSSRSVALSHNLLAARLLANPHPELGAQSANDATSGRQMGIRFGEIYSADKAVNVKSVGQSYSIVYHKPTVTGLDHHALNDDRRLIYQADCDNFSGASQARQQHQGQRAVTHDVAGVSVRGLSASEFGTDRVGNLRPLSHKQAASYLEQDRQQRLLRQRDGRTTISPDSDGRLMYRKGNSKEAQESCAPCYLPGDNRTFSTTAAQQTSSYHPFNTNTFYRAPLQQPQESLSSHHEPSRSNLSRSPADAAECLRWGSPDERREKMEAPPELYNLPSSYNEIGQVNRFLPMKFADDKWNRPVLHPQFRQHCNSFEHQQQQSDISYSVPIGNRALTDDYLELVEQFRPAELWTGDYIQPQHALYGAESNIDKSDLSFDASSFRDNNGLYPATYNRANNGVARTDDIRVNLLSTRAAPNSSAPSGHYHNPPVTRQQQQQREWRLAFENYKIFNQSSSVNELPSRQQQQYHENLRRHSVQSWHFNSFTGDQLYATVQPSMSRECQRRQYYTSEHTTTMLPIKIINASLLNITTTATATPDAYRMARRGDPSNVIISANSAATTCNSQFLDYFQQEGEAHSDESLMLDARRFALCRKREREVNEREDRSRAGLNRVSSPTGTAYDNNRRSHASAVGYSQVGLGHHRNNQSSIAYWPDPVKPLVVGPEAGEGEESSSQHGYNRTDSGDCKRERNQVCSLAAGENGLGGGLMRDAGQEVGNIINQTVASEGDGSSPALGAERHDSLANGNQQELQQTNNDNDRSKPTVSAQRQTNRSLRRSKPIEVREYHPDHLGMDLHLHDGRKPGDNVAERRISASCESLLYKASFERQMSQTDQDRMINLLAERAGAEEKQCERIRLAERNEVAPKIMASSGAETAGTGDQLIADSSSSASSSSSSSSLSSSVINANDLQLSKGWAGSEDVAIRMITRPMNHSLSCNDLHQLATEAPCTSSREKAPRTLTYGFTRLTNQQQQQRDHSSEQISSCSKPLQRNYRGAAANEPDCCLWELNKFDGYNNQQVNNLDNAADSCNSQRHSHPRTQQQQDNENLSSRGSDNKSGTPLHESDGVNTRLTVAPSAKKHQTNTDSHSMATPSPSSSVYALQQQAGQLIADDIIDAVYRSFEGTDDGAATSAAGVAAALSEAETVTTTTTTTNERRSSDANTAVSCHEVDPLGLTAADDPNATLNNQLLPSDSSARKQVRSDQLFLLTGSVSSSGHLSRAAEVLDEPHLQQSLYIKPGKEQGHLVEFSNHDKLDKTNLSSSASQSHLVCHVTVAGASLTDDVDVSVGDVNACFRESGNRVGSEEGGEKALQGSYLVEKIIDAADELHQFLCKSTQTSFESKLCCLSMNNCHAAEQQPMKMDNDEERAPTDVRHGRIMDAKFCSFDQQSNNGNSDSASNQQQHHHHQRQHDYDDSDQLDSHLLRQRECVSAAGGFFDPGGRAETERQREQFARQRNHQSLDKDHEAETAGSQLQQHEQSTPQQSLFGSFTQSLFTIFQAAPSSPQSAAPCGDARSPQHRATTYQVPNNIRQQRATTIGPSSWFGVQRPVLQPGAMKGANERQMSLDIGGEQAAEPVGHKGLSSSSSSITRFFTGLSNPFGGFVGGGPQPPASSRADSSPDGPRQPTNDEPANEDQQQQLAGDVANSNESLSSTVFGGQGSVVRLASPKAEIWAGDSASLRRQMRRESFRRSKMLAQQRTLQPLTSGETIDKQSINSHQASGFASSQLHPQQQQQHQSAKISPTTINRNSSFSGDSGFSEAASSRRMSGAANHHLQAPFNATNSELPAAPVSPIAETAASNLAADASTASAEPQKFQNRFCTIMMKRVLRDSSTAQESEDVVHADSGRRPSLLPEDESRDSEWGDQLAAVCFEKTARQVVCRLRGDAIDGARAEQDQGEETTRNQVDDNPDLTANEPMEAQLEQQQRFDNNSNKLRQPFQTQQSVTSEGSVSSGKLGDSASGGHKSGRTKWLAAAVSIRGHFSHRALTNPISGRLQSGGGASEQSGAHRLMVFSSRFCA